MICGGDELSHTQKGNNNAYCQDNELTWLNWELTAPQQEFLEFAKKVVRVCREQPVFQRRRFFVGRAIRGTAIKDISWLDPSGQEMTDEAWDAGFVKCLGVRLAGDIIGEVDERGEPIVGDTLLMLFNAHHEPLPFALPPHKEGQVWELVFDTADPQRPPEVLPDGHVYDLRDRSMAAFRIQAAPAAAAAVVSAAQAERLAQPPRRLPEPGKPGG
jgi:glycogen operon protein